VEMDGLHWQGSVSEIIVGNSRRYADVTEVTPDAYIDDGLLDVCLITASGPLTASRQLGSLLVRQHPSEASAEMYRAAKMTVRASSVMPLQVDGGHVQVTDDDVTADGIVFTFSLVTQGISVLVPRTYDGALFQPRRLAGMFPGDYSRPLAVSSAVPNAGHHVSNSHKGNARRKHHLKTWRLRVLAAGIDTITARRLKNDKEVHVVIRADTTVAGGRDTDLPASDWLATLIQGDIIEVEGKKDDNGRFIARRMRGQNLSSASQS
jgi:hypothetical protein